MLIMRERGFKTAMSSLDGVGMKGYECRSHKLVQWSPSEWKLLVKL